MTFFEVLAECSIGLAGFGAVHAVLQGSTGPRGIFRAWVVVAQGTLCLILSVLPLLLEMSSLTADALWRVASALGFAGTGAVVYSMLVFDVRMTRLGHAPQAPASIRTAQSSAVAALILMLVNLIGWPAEPGAILFALALLLLLITGLIALLHSFLMPVQIALQGEPAKRSEAG